MIKRIKTACSVIIFLLITAMLFNMLDGLFRRKALGGAWNHTTKIAGFYNEPKESFDLMFFGSSNTYCSFHPLVLWEEKNIRSYVFATQQQPVWATYAYMKEAFKSQKPKAVVLDVLMFSKHQEYYDEGVNHSFSDDLPFSLNKIELACASTPGLKASELLFPFIKYHTRWNELTEADYSYRRKEQRDYLKGYVLLEQTAEGVEKPEVSQVNIRAELSEKVTEYFHKIRSLCAEAGTELILVKTPCNPNPTLQAHLNTIEDMAKASGVAYYDFNRNYEEIGLDLSADFYDKTHLNYSGAEKFTRYFAGLFPTYEQPENTADWNKDLKQYRDYLATIK